VQFRRDLGQPLLWFVVAASGIWTNNIVSAVGLAPGGLRWALPHISGFYFFRHKISELPRPIAVKLCYMIAIWVRFIMQVQKLGGPPPKKLGAQNMQNSARFQTTFEFDREYLRNGWRYPKSERHVFTGDSSRVPWKNPANFGPQRTEYWMWVWAHPNWIFGRLYFGPYGCWPLKF